jgi:hypothetical protein
MIYDPIPLPTVEQCRTFLDIVNKGRKACGLERLDKLDYDGANPGSTANCLSARNLFIPTGAHDVGATAICLRKTSRLIEALHLAQDHLSNGYYRIPDEILVVTDAFDYEVVGLRERLVEAGVV